MKDVEKSRTSFIRVNLRVLREKHLFQCPPDKWIFFPDAGYKYGKELTVLNQSSFYWTSSLYTRRPDYGLKFFMDLIHEDKFERYKGLPIRPVIK